MANEIEKNIKELLKLLGEEETVEEVKLEEDSGEEEGRHYKDDQEADEKHLKALEKDIDYDKSIDDG